MLYPKIETLYDRDPVTFKVIPGKLRFPEFALITHWHVTEKIDGTNVRVWLKPDGSVVYGGRSDNAQMHAGLLMHLVNTLPAAKVAAAFDPGTEAILFGEGYGAGIQKGGAYRPKSLRQGRAKWDQELQGLHRPLLWVDRRSRGAEGHR